jgi:hypothetical protein
MFNEYAGNETLTVDWAEMRSGLDDREAMTSRVTGLFAGGIVTLNEAREQLGLVAVADGALRRIPAAIFEVPEGAMAPVAEGCSTGRTVTPPTPGGPGGGDRPDGEASPAAFPRTQEPGGRHPGTVDGTD